MKLGVLQLGSQFLALLLQLLHRALQILIICLQISQLQHRHTHKRTHLWLFNDNATHSITIPFLQLKDYKCETNSIRFFSSFFFIWSCFHLFLPFSLDVFCSAVLSPACHQTPAGVSFWWSPFHEWLGCILSATLLLEERHAIQKKYLCDIWAFPAFNAGLARYTEEEA